MSSVCGLIVAWILIIVNMKMISSYDKLYRLEKSPLDTDNLLSIDLIGQQPQSTSIPSKNPSKTPSTDLTDSFTKTLSAEDIIQNSTPNIKEQESQSTAEPSTAQPSTNHSLISDSTPSPSIETASTQSTLAPTQPTPTPTAKPTIYMIWHNNSYIHNLTHDEYCDFMHQSLLYVDNCPWSDSIPGEFALLITATPRSGTVFTKSILNSIGLTVNDDWHSPHLNVTDGQISWIDAFYEKVEKKHIGPSRLKESRFNYVFHQVRDPLHSLASMCTEPVEKDKNYKFLNSHIGGVMDRNKQTKAEMVMEFYYHWHMNLNNFGFPIFKVENFYGDDNQTAADTLNWIINTTHLEHKVTNKALLEGRIDDALYTKLHTKVNGRKHRPSYTWDELFLLNEDYAMKIWNLGKEYGYKYDWDYNVFNNVTRYTHPLAKNPKKMITC